MKMMISRKIGNTNAERHGHSKGSRSTRTYEAWERMKKRCLGSYATNFKWYGGRGIKVCDRWLRFDNFLEDMGACPDGMSLDRINPNGDYVPGNCRWLEKRLQARNRRSNRMIALNGETRCIAEWAEKTGIDARVIWKRLKRGWEVEKALTEPVRIR